MRYLALPVSGGPGGPPAMAVSCKHKGHVPQVPTGTSQSLRPGLGQMLSLGVQTWGQAPSSHADPLDNMTLFGFGGTLDVVCRNCAGTMQCWGSNSVSPCQTDSAF